MALDSTQHHQNGMRRMATTTASQRLYPWELFRRLCAQAVVERDELPPSGGGGGFLQVFADTSLSTAAPPPSAPSLADLADLTSRCRLHRSHVGTVRSVGGDGTAAGEEDEAAEGPDVSATDGWMDELRREVDPLNLSIG
ncbi:hypothetical protein E2562_027553 [Oryza meyeriana var. granulata]|uniref:Uncharacterized protein n=1 Tax=Oryza meyeriana var. granulata TaxID=110450 RepID=A0A6G1CHS9_9ORYZ|nr:hypothetical protein E2562_027553 [Oryza meyeriana var. granulata]